MPIGPKIGAFVVGIYKRLPATFRTQVKLSVGFSSLLLRHGYLSSVWHLSFPFRFLALLQHEKSSLHVFSEALRVPFWNTKGGSAFALACQVSPEFSQDSRKRLLAALQIAVGGFLPALSF